MRQSREKENTLAGKTRRKGQIAGRPGPRRREEDGLFVEIDQLLPGWVIETDHLERYMCMFDTRHR